MGSLGTHGKNIEDERGTVEYLYFQLFFDVAQLLRRKFIVENDHSYLFVRVFAFFDVRTNLYKFTATNVCHRMGTVDSLRKTLYDYRAGCACKKIEFVKILIGLTLILIRGYKTYKDGSFDLCIGYYKFFHREISLFIVSTAKINIFAIIYKSILKLFISSRKVRLMSDAPPCHYF